MSWSLPYKWSDRINDKDLRTKLENLDTVQWLNTNERIIDRYLFYLSNIEHENQYDTKGTSKNGFG